MCVCVCLCVCVHVYEWVSACERERERERGRERKDKMKKKKSCTKKVALRVGRPQENKLVACIVKKILRMRERQRLVGMEREDKGK